MFKSMAVSPEKVHWNMTKSGCGCKAFREVAEGGAKGVASAEGESSGENPWFEQLVKSMVKFNTSSVFQ